MKAQRNGERAVRGDNGGAKSGDLQGARRLVGSLFQRQLPLENVSPNLTVVEKNSADMKLTRRRTTSVDGEYKSRQCRDNHSTSKVSLSYLKFTKEAHEEIQGYRARTSVRHTSEIDLEEFI